jgi:hypothetical protein
MEHSVPERVLREAVEEALMDILGEKVRDAFFAYLEASFHVPRADLTDHVEFFVKALSDVFGATASMVLGRAIAKRVYARLGLAFVPKNDYTLTDYLKEAK